jgi:hypothetical protein
MISYKNTPSDPILNTKKKITNILLNNIKYNIKKIDYSKPYAYKIQKNKIKKGEFSRNANNIKEEKDKQQCIDDGDIKDIIIEQDLTSEGQESFMILPNQDTRKDMYGKEVLIINGKIDRYDKDILLYKYDAEDEDEPDIDELLKIIQMEIQDMKEDIILLQEKSNFFYNNDDTRKKYEDYKKNIINIPILNDLYKTIDVPFENIVKNKKYAKIIQDNGL